MMMNGHDTILVDPILPLTNRDVRNAAILECAAIARCLSKRAAISRVPKQIEIEILKLLENEDDHLHNHSKSHGRR